MSFGILLKELSNWLLGVLILPKSIFLCVKVYQTLGVEALPGVFPWQ